jgi:hypothetical protein
MEDEQKNLCFAKKVNYSKYGMKSEIKLSRKRPINLFVDFIFLNIKPNSNK